MSKRMQKIRNIGIMAHIDAGKTTVSERLLFLTGKAHKIGEVHDGQATMDWMVQERERGITITSAVTSFEWKGTEVHLIDTPGHVDFTIEVSRSLRVLDGAVAVFDAVAGVESQTETVWRQADGYGVPRLGFVNKMDRTGADYDRCLEMMEQRFGEHVAPAHVPIGAEGDFVGTIDVITRRGYVWSDKNDPAAFEEIDVPAELSEKVEEVREILLERTALADEDFAMVYLEEPETLTIDIINAAIRRSVIAGKLVPVLCGSALRNKGIQPLLDAIVAWLPSPMDVPPIEGIVPKTGEPTTRPHDAKAPLAALAYKVAIMEDGRRMVFMRLYSGTLTAGADLWNPALGVKEKVSRIFMMHANNRTRLEKVEAGNIFGVLGLKKTRTGDTLCVPTDHILLESIDAYEPVISLAVEPATLREKEKLETTLAKLADEDPTFRWREDEGTGQTIISGMGELHLEILMDRLKREFKVEVRSGSPQVVYREAITAEAKADETFERGGEEGGEYVFGHVALKVAPAERGAGHSIVWKWPADGKDLPKGAEAVKTAVEEGITQSFVSGPLHGYQLDDVTVTVTAVELKDTPLTNLIGYTVAASTAMRAALKAATPVRLSPVGDVEVTMPPEHTGDVISSLTIRRGKIETMEELSPLVSLVKASVPMERMFGYATEVRSLTQGRAQFSMTFSHYDNL